MDDSPQGVDGDTEWNTWVTVRITADPRLAPDQREVIETDYGMWDGVLEIPTRARLVPYVLQLLRIDSGTMADDPAAQQIVVANQAELQPWLFG
jgi:hypothetical protein